jgi:GT2 family glycosyltransferase
VDWISGCSILVRRQVLEQIGFIDERYFYYWEETELCIRARGQGWRIVHVPRARLWHKGVQLNYQPKPSVTYYATRNRLLTLTKHRAPAVVQVVAWLQLFRTLASWTVRPKWRHLRAHRDAMWRGVWDYLFRRWGQMPD